MRNRRKVLAFAVFSAALAFSDIADGVGAPESLTQQVTVTVPQFREIISETDQFTLTFEDYVKGSETNQFSVNYIVKANKMQRDSGVVRVQVDQPADNFVLQAKGGSYNKEGGTATLLPVSSNFVNLSTTPTSLYDREIDSADGKILKGNMSIAYKAVAQEDLVAGDISIALTITLADT